MATKTKSSVLDDGVCIEELNTRTINLAFYLKMLTVDEQKNLVSLASIITFEELMSVVNIMSPKIKNEKIESLKTKYALPRRVS